LLHSLKNQREHQFVVDSIKMKLEAITTQLNVPSNPILLQNKQVQHLYTPISGTLSANMSVKDLVDNLHPTPALGGVPQKEALQYIAQHEQQPRGLFAGPIGYVTADNTGELVVGIRSMYCEQTRARLFAGAGIVAGSEAQQEYDETALKFEPMLQLLGELTHD
ncbi:isochorismate synthase, partial [Leuconostoc pseudomesenteroides]